MFAATMSGVAFGFESSVLNLAFDSRNIRKTPCWGIMAWTFPETSNDIYCTYRVVQTYEYEMENFFPDLSKQQHRSRT